MTIFTVQTTVSEKNLRDVNTQNGVKQVISVPVIKDKNGDWLYAAAWLNFPVHMGDGLLISGRLKGPEGEYSNYTFIFPTIEKLWQPDKQQQPMQQQPMQQQPMQASSDPFKGGKTLNIQDDDLPF